MAKSKKSTKSKKTSTAKSKKTSAKKDSKKTKSKKSSGNVFKFDNEGMKGANQFSTGAGGSWIKIAEGNNAVYLVKKEFAVGSIHFLNRRPFRCLGNLTNKEWSPQTCPACKTSMKYFDLKKNAKKKKDKSFYNDMGKEFQAATSYVLAAVQGKLTKKGGKTVVKYTDPVEAKFLKLTSTQFDQLKGREGKKPITSLIDNKDFPQVEEWDDLFNRALVLKKEAGQNGRVTIIPSKRGSDAPEYENDLPDLEEAFPDYDVDGMKAAIKEVLDKEDEDLEDEDEDELDAEEEDGDEDEEDDDEESEDDEEEEEDSDDGDEDEEESDDEEDDDEEDDDDDF